MSDEALYHLAKLAGVAASWKDVFGVTHGVEPPTLRAVLRALDLAADTDAQLADSTRRRNLPSEHLPPLVTARRGFPVELPATPSRYLLTLEDGRQFDGFAEPHAVGAVIPAILEPGIHRLEMGGIESVIAVAPSNCFTAPEAMGAPRGWGLAVQLYALRRHGDAGIGDFTALAELAPLASRHGAQAIAISPVHAQFSADPDRFSPYAPSSRTALNVLHASVDTHEPAMESAELIDWPKAARFRLHRLRSLFEQARGDAAEQAALTAFIRQQGARLRDHAIFESLHQHFFGSDNRLWHWRDWPDAFRTPNGPAVLAFEREYHDVVEFHAWMQFRADRGLREAQAACRNAGMSIGLISDLAVGVDSGGSQCWSRQDETLLGLTVGAPPDLLQRHGQNWGLTAFSPHGLIRRGFATYIDMLHTALSHAGGMRIDHAMGLNRLWVIPDGGSGADGTYLSYPETDMFRLIALESQRRHTIVLAEDLGTVPDGFQDRLRGAGICGMRVLWFERDQAENYVPPAHWTHRAAAMTSTHDLPTVAGWWAARDLEWREQLGHLPDPAAAHQRRAEERTQIWNAFRSSGAGQGDPPAPTDGADAADAACIHVGNSACELVMLPIEDALALTEQPNLPGTLDEHPNWRRRLPLEPFDAAASKRMTLLDQARRS